MDFDEGTDDVVMNQYTEKYATTTNFKALQNPTLLGEMYRTTSVPQIEGLDEERPGKSRTKPRAMLSNFDLMMQHGVISNNGVGDTPSCIEMITLDECSMFVNSVGKLENFIEEEKE
jgi:hypothetical protein